MFLGVKKTMASNLVYSKNTQFDNIFVLNAVDGDSCSIRITEDTVINSSRCSATIQLKTNDTTATYYHWSPSEGLNDTTIPNPIATVNSSRQYVLEAMYEGDSNLVYNGDFSLGNNGFTSALTYVANSGAHALWDPSQYTVGTNPYDYHSLFESCTHDGNMFIANGAVTSNVVVWQQSITVEPNTLYAFSCEAVNVDGGIGARLQFSINGTQIGDIFTIQTHSCHWRRFYVVWYSSMNTTAIITILNQNTNEQGNDFAMDNISFRKICVATDTVNIKLITQKEISATICQGQTYTDNGFNVSESGVYMDTLQSTMGCDSIIKLNLTVSNASVTNIEDTICEGEVYNANGFEERTAGTYFDTIPNVSGCDSVVKLTLVLLPKKTTFIQDTIDMGQTYCENGFDTKIAGIYVRNLQTYMGCDSTVTLQLFVRIFEDTVELWLPNTFTPLAETNREFCYYTTDSVVRVESFEIYNRWGKRVFSLDSSHHCWDGKTKGQLCPQGVYVYKIIYTKNYTASRRYFKQGTVNLIR